MKNIQEKMILSPDKGKANDTKRLQAAIDKASREGIWVVFREGRYHTGTLHLRSNSKIELLEGCEIIGSEDLSDYTVDEYCHQSKKNCWQSVFFGKHAEHIVIKGKGSILGQGDKFPFGLEAFSADDWAQSPVQEFKVRPSLLYFKGCSDIKIEGVELKDAAQFAVLVEECEDIVFKNVNVHNRKNRNTDGFHFSWNRNIFIQECILDCGDDAIVFNRSAINAQIKNCNISSRWAGVRIGPFSDGEFSGIEVADCQIHDTYGCAVKIQIGQGGNAHDIHIHHVNMENVTGPIHINLCHIPDWEDNRNISDFPGRLSDITIEHINAHVTAEPLPLSHEVPMSEGEKFSCVNIQGREGHKIERLTFRNWDITYEGGYKDRGYTPHFTEEADYRYPEYFLFGIMPCYALYAVHVAGFVLEHVNFRVQKRDVRIPVMVYEANRMEWKQVFIEGNRVNESRF